MGRYIKSIGGLIFILFLFSVLIGFRDISVGVDTRQYEEIYENIGFYGYTGYPEPLFGYINLAFSKLGFNFTMFQWALSLIILGLIGTVVKRNSSNYGYSMFVLYGCFFIFYTMNITRQMLAVAFLLYGYHDLIREKKIKFLICVLLATLCHAGAILALSVLFLRKINLNSFFVFLLIAGTLLCGIFIAKAFIPLIAARYGAYLEAGNVNGFRDGQRLALAVVLAGWWSLLFLILFSMSPWKARNSFWFKIYFLSILVNNLLLSTELGTRVTLYFSCAQVIVFSHCLKFRKKKSMLSPAFIIGFFIMIFYFIFSYNGSTGVFPYKFASIF